MLRVIEEASVCWRLIRGDVFFLRVPYLASAGLLRIRPPNTDYLRAFGIEGISLLFITMPRFYIIELILRPD